MNADEYRVFKKRVSDRKLPSGRGRRPQIVLSPNQDYTIREIAATLGCSADRGVSPGRLRSP